MEFKVYKMLYKIKNPETRLKILGKNFVKNNLFKGKLIINNKKQKISESININGIRNDKFKVKLLLKRNIYNKSYFFKDCSSLIELSTSNKELKTFNNRNNYISEIKDKIINKTAQETGQESLYDKNLYIEEEDYVKFYNDDVIYPYNNIFYIY